MIIIGGFILTECIDNLILELAFIPIMIVSLIFALFGLIRLIQVKNEVFRLKRITCSKCKNPHYGTVFLIFNGIYCKRKN